MMLVLQLFLCFLLLTVCNRSRALSFTSVLAFENHTKLSLFTVCNKSLAITISSLVNLVLLDYICFENRVMLVLLLFSYIPMLVLIDFILFFLQMASSSFNNQQPDVEMQGEDQEFQETNVTSQANKAKKMVVPRSTVWEHFTRTKENRNKCICHHCEKTFSCASKSGTSNLKQHLQICREHKAWLTSQKKNQQQIGNGGNLKGFKVSEALFKEALNELVVLAELPLSFIESTAFKHFCDKVHCRLFNILMSYFALELTRFKLTYSFDVLFCKVNLRKPHSRRTLTRNIVEMFVKKKAALKNLLISSKQRVSLTTDIWLSQVTGTLFFFN